MNIIIKRLLLASILVGAVLFFYVQWQPPQTHCLKPGMIKHLGIMMDGNRRWARKAGLAPYIGHKKGVDPFKMTVKFCLKNKIPYLTLYTFSIENFKRPQEELDYLFNVLAKELASNELDELFKQGVKVIFAGDRSLFPQQLVSTIKDIEEKTKDGKNLTLTLLFCYGGQQEIIDATKKIVTLVKNGTLSPDAINKDHFENCLWTGKMPPPDLIIRTGRRQCMSNFLCFQAAYSELYFSDLYWPEFTENDLIKALESYCERARNFGA